MAADLGRFLNGEPIIARPARTLERSLKWVRRHPLPAALACVSFLATFAIVIALFSHNYNEQLKSINASLEATSAELQSTLQVVQFERTEADVQRERADDLHYAVTVHLADRARVRGDVPLALNTLDGLRPAAADAKDRRGFEWYFLWRACHGHLPLLRGHTDGISAIAFSPDGNQLAMANRDKSITICDTETGELQHILRDFPVDDVTYSPDGKTLAAVGSADKGTASEIRVWDFDSQQATNGVIPAGGVRHIAYCADGKRVIAASDRSIYVWEIAAANFTVLSERTPVRVSTPGIVSTTWRPVADIVISPDERLFGLALWDRVELWDMESGTIVLTHEDGHLAGGRTLAFNRAGDLLAIPAYSTVKVIQTATGEVIFTAKSKDIEFSPTVAFSSDGRSLVTPTNDGTVKFWDIESGKERMSIPGWGPDQKVLAFNPDCSKLAVAGYSPSDVKLVSLAPPQEAKIINISKPRAEELGDSHAERDAFQRGRGVGPSRTLAFSPDGKWLAAPGAENTVDIWEANSWKYAFSLTGQPGSNAHEVAFSPDSRWLAASTFDGGIVWNLQDREPVFTAPKNGSAHSTHFSSHRGRGKVSFSSNADLLAITSSAKPLQLWKVASWKEELTLAGLKGQPNAISFSPDARCIAQAYSDGKIDICEVASGLNETTLVGHVDRVSTVTYNPDGRLLASGSYDRTLKLWDLAGGKVVWTFHGHSANVNSVAFSPDGRRLVSGSDDRTIKVWDVATGQQLLSITVLTGRPPIVYGVAFSPDGRFIATTGEDSLIRIWDGSPK